jgi:hypothetical protein
MLLSYVEDNRRLPLSEAVSSIDSRNATIESLFYDFNVEHSSELPVISLCPANPIRSNVLSSYRVPTVGLIRPFPQNDLYRPTTSDEGLMTPFEAVRYLEQNVVRWIVVQDRVHFHLTNQENNQLGTNSWFSGGKGSNAFWSDGSASVGR